MHFRLCIPGCKASAWTCWSTLSDFFKLSSIFNFNIHVWKQAIKSSRWKLQSPERALRAPVCMTNSNTILRSTKNGRCRVYSYKLNMGLIVRIFYGICRPTQRNKIDKAPISKGVGPLTQLSALWPFLFLCDNGVACIVIWYQLSSENPMQLLSTIYSAPIFENRSLRSISNKVCFCPLLTNCDDVQSLKTLKILHGQPKICIKNEQWI